MFGFYIAISISTLARIFLGINTKTITFTLTANGRASGECYAELDDVDAVKEARKLDRNEISGRYIEGLF